jgi:hypothetical protein
MTHQDRFGLMILEMVKERDALANEKNRIVALVSPEGTPPVSCLDSQIMGIHTAMRIAIRVFSDMFGGQPWKDWEVAWGNRLTNI